MTRTARHRLIVLPAGALALATCVGALAFGGSTTADPSALGLDPGDTPWLLPLARLTMECAAVATVGFLIAAVFFQPGEYADGEHRLVVSAEGRYLLHLASWAAIVWSVAAAATAAFTMSDLLGVPVGDAATPNNLYVLITQIDTGKSLTVVFVLTMSVAIASQFAQTVSAAAAVTALAVVAVLPPTFTGHAASSASHELATSSLMLHVVGAVLWAGGLLALVAGHRRPVVTLTAAVGRFSRLAIVSIALVAASGVLNALLRVNAVADLATRYGALLLGKLLLVVVLAGFGWWHRRTTLPALAAGRSGAFVRIAGVEVLVLAVTFGLAAGLARTAPPSKLRIDELLDIPLRRIMEWLPDLVFLAVAAAAVCAYLIGVRRMRGHHWPVTRTAAWIGGWVLVALATDVQLTRSGAGMFGLTDRVQHLTIGVLAPLLLAAGSAGTVARLALRPSTEVGMRGPSEWLAVLGESLVVRALSHPVGLLLLFASSVYALYVGVEYSFALTSHAGHLSVFAFALLSGWFVATRLLDHGLRETVRVTLGFAVLAMLALLVLVLTVSVALPSSLSSASGQAVPPSVFTGQWLAATCLSTLAVWLACSISLGPAADPPVPPLTRDLVGTDLKTPSPGTLPRQLADAQTPNPPRRSVTGADQMP